jgi:hypothetical protein
MLSYYTNFNCRRRYEKRNKKDNPRHRGPTGNRQGPRESENTGRQVVIDIKRGWFIYRFSHGTVVFYKYCCSFTATHPKRRINLSQHQGLSIFKT